MPKMLLMEPSDIIISIRKADADALCYNGKCDIRDDKVFAMYIKMGIGGAIDEKIKIRECAISNFKRNF